MNSEPSGTVRGTSDLHEIYIWVEVYAAFVTNKLLHPQSLNDLLLLYTAMCKDKIPKFLNKYSQKRNIGVSPNFHIHVSESDLYIPTIGIPIWLEEICRPILGLYKSLTDT
jgi:hypothetical protein